jgi:hypothetical protein
VNDRGRLLDPRQVHNREVAVRAGIGVDRKGGVDEDPVAIRGVLVEGNRQAGGGQPDTVEPVAQFVAASSTVVLRPSDRRDIRL